MRIAALISGGGTTVANIAERIADGTLDVQIAGVIASNDGAAERFAAKGLDLPVEVVRRKDFDGTASFSAAMWRRIEAMDAELVCLGGFLSLLTIEPAWRHRVVNIHPALLPAFGGQGMYGHHVHEAVLEHGCKISGCTVHFADQQYDHGPIIVQRACPVLEDDTPDTLAARVFEQECIAYPEALQAIARGRVQVHGRRVRIMPSAD